MNARGEVRYVAWIAAVVIIALIPLVAGCKIEMALDTQVEVDGSGSVGIRLAADKEILDLMLSSGGPAEGDLFGEFQQGVPEGWDAESGTDPDGTRWVTAKRLFDQPSDLDSLFEQGADSPAESLGVSGFALTQDKGFFSVETSFSATWDMESVLAGTGEELPAGVGIGSLASIFEVQNRLTLPGSIKDNNADEVQGNTLIWRPSLAGPTEMHATSVAYRWPVILGIAGASLAGLIAVIVIVLLVIFLPRRGRQEAVLAPVVAPPQPAPSVPLTPDQYAASAPTPAPTPAPSAAPAPAEEEGSTDPPPAVLP